MIRQKISIDKYHWTVWIYYSVHSYYADEIMTHLKEIGIDGENSEAAYRNLKSGEVNSGLTYSNYRTGKSVVVIGKASCAAQYENSIRHEQHHLSTHIATAAGIPLDGEEVCYLDGKIAELMHPKSKLLTSECGCYTRQIDKSL